MNQTPWRLRNTLDDSEKEINAKENYFYLIRNAIHIPAAKKNRLIEAV
ncbi:hypothetical protein [Kushneria avicenniae]|nr:hypothetical protein [Kushneria avicenniae]